MTIPGLYPPRIVLPRHRKHHTLMLNTLRPVQRHIPPSTHTRIYAFHERAICQTGKHKRTNENKKQNKQTNAQLHMPKTNVRVGRTIHSGQSCRPFTKGQARHDGGTTTHQKGQEGGGTAIMMGYIPG